MFRPMIQFELIFVYGVRYGDMSWVSFLFLSFFFTPPDGHSVQLFQHRSLKRLSFLHSVAVHHCRKSIDYIVWGPFSGLYFVPLNWCLVFLPMTRCLDFCGFHYCYSPFHFAGFFVCFVCLFFFSWLPSFQYPSELRSLTVSIQEVGWWMKGKNPSSIEQLSLL